jgi:peptide chain release factor subunit 1
LSAITSAQVAIKKYTRTPPNGLVVYCGDGVDPDTHKEKKFHITFEPSKPLNHSYYRCDSSFHTHFLEEMIIDYDTFGFIIIDGKETIYATLNGNEKRILSTFSVILPKKHNKGGQSSVRFARLRDEAIHNYITKVCERANQHFIEKDKLTVKGIILAGSADLKHQIEKHNKLDFRINSAILAKVDVAYGGLNGLNQAISESTGILNDVKIKEEQELLREFYDHIAKDTNQIMFGVNTIMSNLEGGVIEKLIMFQDLEYYRIIDEEGNEKFVKSLEGESFKESTDIIDYLMEVCDKNGISLIPVTDSTSDGNQFVHGFGGLGAILRFPMEVEYVEEINEENDFDDFI